MRRIWAIARKEFIHIIRDPRLLMVILAMPLLQLFLYSYALSFDVKALPTATLDYDHTTQSRQYLDALQQSGYFKINQTLGSYADVDKAFQSNSANVVVVVGSGFGDALTVGRPANVQILIDGSDANSAQLAQGYSAALSRVYGGKVVVSQVEAKGFSTGSMASLGANTRVWYNPEGKSAAYYVPALIVVLVTMVLVLQTANTLVREKDNGTYEQLIVSPMRKIELMIGKIAPWALIGALQIVMISVIGVVFFQVPFRGSVLLLAAASLLYVICALGMGLIISARASSVDTANQLAGLIAFLPTFMLSGFIFPISSMPWPLQLVSYCFPGRYFMVITRTIFLKGGGVEVLWPQMLALTVFAVAIISLAAVMYQERA
jgi:ABC-2 type transport system permease protein